MHPNFSNLRLKYSHHSSWNLDFALSSLNFDINHTTIGRNTPFTAEMSFEFRIEDNGNINIRDLQSFSNFLNQQFQNSSQGIANTNNGRSTEDRIRQISNLIQTQIFNASNIRVQFKDIDTETANIDSTTSNSVHTLANPINVDQEDLFSLAWAVKVKFHLKPIIATGTPTPAPSPTILFPALELTGSALANNEGLEEFNEVLRINYELSYLPEPDNTQPVASPLGRVADEISDSITTLTNTIATNLNKTITTQLQPAGSYATEDIALWVLIRKGAEGLSFTSFLSYMDEVFCGTKTDKSTWDDRKVKERANQLDKSRALPFMNVDAYSAVKIATEAFVMVNCMAKQNFSSEDVEELRRSVRLVNGVPNERELTEYYNKYKVKLNGGEGLIPYLAIIRRKLANDRIKNTSFEDAFDFYLSDGEAGKVADNCYGLISDKLNRPCFLELIWSYWHEESMMVQGLNAISRRFQNIRGNGKVDPLANLEIDPLRPLNNLLWGYIQDHQHRLTVRRRAYEYNHHYGMSLRGEAARDMRFADPRSKFIEAFHTLLNLASRYYKQADDMTVKPDGFPILNGLRETHLILSEGAHNQYGDLPSTARAEMLMEQWLLARPEFREFLPTRVMTAYPEPWMDRVAALNQMMGWTKTSVLHFNYLAVFGEKILLSIRFGNWADTGITADAASNWANFWRQEIQGYIHAYRAVTGVDLSADGVAAGQRVDTLQPSVHLYRRLQEQQNGRKVA